MGTGGRRRKAAARKKAEGRASSRIRANLKTAKTARSARRGGTAAAAPAGVAMPPFIANKIELWPLAKLLPLERNPRIHSDAEVDELVRVIMTVGFLVPLLVDLKSRRILAGNRRFAAAVKIGMAKVPVIVADHLSPALRQAWIVADNEIALHATWDETILAEYFRAIERAGLDPTLTCFSTDAISEILASVGPHAALEEEEEVPPLPAKAVSKRGDLWALGNHRVFCGDATVPDDVLRLVGGATMDCVWTDPPYGVSYKGAAGEIQNDDLPERELAAMLAAALGAAYAVMHEGAPIYMAHADTGGHIFRRVLIESGFKLASCLIWRKNSLVLSRGDYHWQHEPILYGWKPGSAHRWYGDRDKTSILEFDDPPFAQVADDQWQISLGERTLLVRGKGLTVQAVRGSVLLEEKPSVNREHPTMKPTPLVARMLANSTRPGHRVLDMFAGSGSTLIACESRMLIGYMLELEPRYVDVIVQRWQNLTGGKATLGSGRTFDQIATGRKRGE